MNKYGNTPGERIRIRRKELQLDVRDVARQAGLAVTTLYELENGRQRRSTRMHAVCAVLGLRDEYVETGRLPRLSSEAPESKVVKESQAKYMLHGMLTTDEEVEFGIEWGKLHEPARSLFKQQVLLLVAAQKRADREGRKRRQREDHDGDPH